MSTGINIGKSIKVLDEGSTLTSDVAQINFTGSGVTATAVGNNVTVNVTGSSGVWGISNASGVYTYYATLTLAMAAAVAGQTVELFADVTESSATPVTLVPNVIIQGNGHTYKHTSTTGYTFITPNTGTYTFANIKISRIVTTPTGAPIFAGNAGAFYHTYTMLFQSSLVEYNYTASVGDTSFFNTLSVHVYNIDGLRATTNGSGAIIPQAARSLSVKNCYLQSTGTGGCFSGENFNPLSVIIENCHLEANSGFCISNNYSLNVARNCTAITTSGTAIGGGGTAIECYAFSNSGIAIIASAFNCTASTVSGIGYYQASAWQSIGTSATGRAVVPFFIMSYYYNCTFRTTNNATASDANYPAKFYNCTIESTWADPNGHAISLNGVGVEVHNSYLSVANTSANCLRGAGAITAKYSNNAFQGATTPINANVTQGITNTQDNQGNILI